MQFTKAEEYGVLGILYLAEQGKDNVIPLSEIAENQEIPEKFLAKIFQNLTRTGLVRSYRGVRGGYALSKDPNTVTLTEVVEAIQGPYHLISCLYDRTCCGKYTYCPLRAVLEKAEVKLMDVFGSHTISDLKKWKKNHPATRA